MVNTELPKQEPAANWPLLQLQRMTRFMPERVEDAMHRLFELDPALRNDLVIGAVDQEMLTVEQAAEFTGIPAHDIERRLVEFRQLMAQREVKIEKNSEKAVARIAGVGVSVWEIVREWRRVGDMPQLHASFPSLTANELAVALTYAESHREEIDREIERYEAVVARRRSEYPFAK